jgi:predicted  nucleic acid-binding Zn-ribbon protein
MPGRVIEGGKSLKTLLENFIKLQEVDNKLNTLKLQKGDLPMLIEQLQEDLKEKKERSSELEETVNKMQRDRRMFEKEVDASKAQLKKYEEQLYKVQNNKEYDAISLEIDTKKAEIESLENKIIQTLEDEEELKKERAELSEGISTLETQYQEYQKELEEINIQTREEETRLQHEREKVARQIEERYLRLYERIRQAKDGLAVAPIKRSSCGGCFSAIPPQRIVEIREAGRLHTCEHCGRILVWVGE